MNNRDEQAIEAAARAIAEEHHAYINTTMRTDIARTAIAAYEAALWQPMETYTGGWAIFAAPEIVNSQKYHVEAAVGAYLCNMFRHDPIFEGEDHMMVVARCRVAIDGIAR